MLTVRISGTYGGAGTQSPERYSPPWGGWEVMDLHGELAVVEGAQRPEQLTAGRDRFLDLGAGYLT